MLGGLARAMFSGLAASGILKPVASRYGMRRRGSFARRFVAGETIGEALDAARLIERAGIATTLDHLGERVTTTETAAEATRDYVAIVGAMEKAGVGRNLSVKLSQLGIDVDRATSVDNLRRVLDAAAHAGFFVRIDMERSEHAGQTLDTFETLWNIGYRNAGVVVQAYLRRSAGDVHRINALGARIRLVKGAYNERRDAAFQQKSEVDAAFVDLMKILLTKGTYPAIATHDPIMIAATKEFALASGIRKEKYEFQMLYGIRRDVQTRLSAEGHPVRVYIPFGREWFPYFMRRLGERPANVGFVIKSLLREPL
jgi:proline dehydrogenase